MLINVLVDYQLFATAQFHFCEICIAHFLLYKSDAGAKTRHHFMTIARMSPDLGLPYTIEKGTFLNIGCVLSLLSSPLI